MRQHQIASAIFSLILIGGGSMELARGASARNTIIGVALSPAHFPNFSDHDLDVFFEQAAQIGGHVTWIFEWESLPPPIAFKVIPERTRQKGLKLTLYLSPIALFGGRKNPAVPKSVGGNSFGDPKVRKAYTDEVLEIASIRPDYLGLATEVNFLAQNPSELASFVSLTHEAYAAVKKKYPDQTVTLSFQWEVMRAHQQFDVLKQFAGSLDVYSFTSYPDAFGDPSKAKAPDDYYSSVRKYLPNERLGFSEIGWSSAPPSNEQNQAAFFARLPDFTRSAKFEFATLALLHDVSLFTGELERLNHVGIRTIDDAPKKSWDVILNLPELRCGEVTTWNAQN